MCQQCNQPSYIPCNCISQAPQCEECVGDICPQKLDAQCIIFNWNCENSVGLTNLGIPCGTNLETIFSKIDSMVGTINIPFSGQETASIEWIAGGAAGHEPFANVKISDDANNILEEHADGLYVPETVIPDAPPPVFVNESNDCISINVTTDIDGSFHITPSIDVICLLNKIKNEQPVLFCELLNDCGIVVTPTFEWVANTTACKTEDLDIVTDKTFTDAGNPVYMFTHNGYLYVVNTSSPTGNIFRVNPATATSMTDAEYINETRSGTPYGPSGGTYTSGAPYIADHDAGLHTDSIIIGAFFDEATETLFVHGMKIFGMDYLDLSTMTWGKVSVGSTGSVYNTTLSSDLYTHIGINSSQSSNILITGWGDSGANRGRYVVTVNKATRTMIMEVDSNTAVFTPTITGNPFTKSWEAFITNDDRIFVSKGASQYKDIAVFDSSLVPITQIIEPNSTLGFNSDSLYWAASFIDSDFNKFYYTDFTTRKVDVFDTNTYALIKTFNLDNYRTFTKATTTMTLVPVTGELFLNVLYGDNSASSTPNGIADALTSDTVTYKINRTSLEIEKIYIGEPRTLFVKASAFYYGSAIGIGADPSDISTPNNPGTLLIYQENPTPLFTGIKDILTLKEINSVTSIPTGNTKTNLISDPDYIAPVVDTTSCPISYTLNAPSRLIATILTNSYNFEFGLNINVYNNPVLDHITVTLRNATTASTIASTTFNIPNTPNIAAFFNNALVAVGLAGQSWAIDINYFNAASVNIASYNNFITGVIL